MRRARCAPQSASGGRCRAPAAGWRCWRRRSAAPFRKPSAECAGWRRSFPSSCLRRRRPAPAGCTCGESSGSICGRMSAGISSSLRSHCCSTGVRRAAQSIDARARPQPADGIEPVRLVGLHQRVLTVEQQFLLHRQPEIRRMAAQGVAEETRRRDTDQGGRLSVDEEGRADQRWDPIRRTAARCDSSSPRPAARTAGRRRRVMTRPTRRRRRRHGSNFR